MLNEENTTFPVLPLRDIVVFPHMIVPLFVGREKSVRALEEVMKDNEQILLSSQVDPAEDIILTVDALNLYPSIVLNHLKETLVARVRSHFPDALGRCLAELIIRIS